MSVKPRIVLGTKNQDKVRELRAMLKSSGVEVLSLEDFPHCPEAHENGRTFVANARKKARAYSKHTKLLTLADDSGLMVRALNGKPGVYSARFAGEDCSYRDNNQKVLKLLQGLPEAKRGAQFISVIALYDNGRFVNAVKGVCAGRITRQEIGRHGFGYDPIFIPRGLTKTFSQLSPAQKNKISHRGKALRAAKKIILAYLLKHGL